MVCSPRPGAGLVLWTVTLFIFVCEMTFVIPRRAGTSRLGADSRVPASKLQGDTDKAESSSGCGTVTLVSTSTKCMASPGRWVPLPTTQPPYALEHLQDVHMERVHGCKNRWPDLFGWGWAESAKHAHETPRLMDAGEMCDQMEGMNMLIIGDSLSLQLYDSWRARLRQSRCGAWCSEQTAQEACAGTCEGVAPSLCSDDGQPWMCTGGVQYTSGNSRGALYSSCDNGASVSLARAWLL